MRHKVLSQLLERHWVTCLFFTRTQSHNSERKRACAQQKGGYLFCRFPNQTNTVAFYTII